MNSVQTIESQTSHAPTRSLNFIYKKLQAEKIDRDNRVIFQRLANSTPDPEFTVENLLRCAR